MKILKTFAIGVAGIVGLAAVISLFVFCIIIYWSSVILFFHVIGFVVLFTVALVLLFIICDFFYGVGIKIENVFNKLFKIKR